MNYLAHSFLSNMQPALIVGNFIADHLHGNHFENYPNDIVEGIKMHRLIDSFTDSHVKFKESKRFFYKGFEKYSGILIDIYFDHLLAKNFSKYSNMTLDKYCEFIYTIYAEYKTVLPQSSSGFLDYVLQNNIYHAYSTLEGIEQVLFHLSHRINHGVLLNDSITLFKAHEKELEENFKIFFKDALTTFSVKTK